MPSPCSDPVALMNPTRIRLSFPWRGKEGQRQLGHRARAGVQGWLGGDGRIIEKCTSLGSRGHPEMEFSGVVAKLLLEHRVSVVLDLAHAIAWIGA